MISENVIRETREYGAVRLVGRWMWMRIGRVATDLRKDFWKMSKFEMRLALCSDNTLGKKFQLTLQDYPTKPNMLSISVSSSVPNGDHGSGIRLAEDVFNGTVLKERSGSATGAKLIMVGSIRGGPFELSRSGSSHVKGLLTQPSPTLRNPEGTSIEELSNVPMVVIPLWVSEFPKTLESTRGCPNCDIPLSNPTLSATSV